MPVDVEGDGTCGGGGAGLAPWGSVPIEPDPRTQPARVVTLAGPSGCGKTRLADESGLPVVTLDDFYLDGGALDLPRTSDGTVDWDHPGSWDLDAAVDALTRLCAGGSVEVPTYSFGEDRAVGRRLVERRGARIVIAEGIFAAELVAPLRERGLLADALLIQENRWITFVRRLVRDLREGRKPPWYLLRQGWAKAANEAEIVARLRSLGARPVSKPEARAVLARLAATGAPAAPPPVAAGRGPIAAPPEFA